MQAWIHLAGGYHSVSDQQPGEQITLYTTTWCSDCRMVKRYFAQHNIPYVEINIESDPDSAAAVEQLNGGYRSVPTFRYGDKIITEPSVRELDALFMGQQGH